jgi:hypothetical protein
MVEIAIKRGAALRMQLTFQQDDSTPADLTAVALSGQIRTVTDELVTNLPIVRTAARGVATIEVDDTTQWPIGLLRGDVKAVVGGVPILSDTFGVAVRKAVTR